MIEQSLRKRRSDLVLELNSPLHGQDKQKMIEAGNIDILLAQLELASAASLISKAAGRPISITKAH